MFARVLVVMTIDSQDLDYYTLEVAKEKFGSSVFERRPLMLAVESFLKNGGDWTASDDLPSGSSDGKSVGLASIDNSIRRLGFDGLLLHKGTPRSGLWTVGASGTCL